MTTKPAAKRRSDFHKIMATVRYRLGMMVLARRPINNASDCSYQIYDPFLSCVDAIKNISFSYWKRERKRNCKTAVPKTCLAERVQVVRISFRAKC